MFKTVDAIGQEVCLVTGVAGFIGSHLAEALIARGYRVIGVDAFTDFYPRAIKEQNLQGLQNSSAFRLLELDLSTANLSSLLLGVDYVFHLAAQAGVRSSWGKQFTAYVDYNVLATQRLLEAALHSHVQRVIYASSSSVYGNARVQPVHEDSPTQPISPYGVTKLAGEHLCTLYAREHSLSTIALRYFTVYGPRQRPDMGFHKFIHSLLCEQVIQVYGDGQQSRDFTYVDDIVAANLAAMHLGTNGAVYNIGGGTRVTVREVLRMLESITEKQAHVVYQTRQYGDATHTAADTSAAYADLGFQPAMTLEQGLRMQVEWMHQLYS